MSEESRPTVDKKSVRQGIAEQQTQSTMRTESDKDKEGPEGCVYMARNTRQQIQDEDEVTINKDVDERGRENIPG
jgi:hypothetical protein